MNRENTALCFGGRRKDSMSSTGKKGEQTRQRILDSALELFATQGFPLTRVKDIAATADVSEPLLYKYFKSKKDIYLTLLNTLAGDIDKIWDQAESTHQKPEDILRVGGLSFCASVTTKKTGAAIIFRTLTETSMSEVVEFSKNTQVRIHDRIQKHIETGVKAGTFRSDIDAGLAAWQFMSIGYTSSLLSVLGLDDQMGVEKIMSWGDSFVERLKP